MKSVGYVSDLFSRQFDSLTGVPSSSYWPTQTIILTQSDFTVLNVSEAKNILPVWDGESDSHITALITAVQEQIGRYIKIDLTRRTRQSYWNNPYNLLKLSFGPHYVIDSVILKDKYGNTATLVDGTDYVVYGENGYYKQIEILQRPITGNQFYITYNSGYEAGDCPDAIRMACVQELNLQYKRRQDGNQQPVTIINGLTAEARVLLETYIRRI
jgi:hypothetical protein